VDPDSKSRKTRSTRITVSVTDGRGRTVSAPGLAAWLARVAPAAARGEIGVALASDARVRSFNKRYRLKDRATDVLSFEPSDIVIATGVARRQAREAGHSYATELKVLALHGLLHLLGYDHHDPADGGMMARVERRLRIKGGLTTGLIERAVTRERAMASEPRERSEPAKRHASARVGESEGRSPSADR
jgi:probable rRNA maturation factor